METYTGYRTVQVAIWQIFYELLIFYKTTAKYEKQIKYLSTLHEVPCYNYFIISSQKYTI